MIKLKSKNLVDLIWEWVGDKWLVGRVAAALFAVSAVALDGVSAIALLKTRWLGMYLAGIGSLMGFYLFPLIFAGFFLMEGMKRYWLMRDRGSKRARRVWFFPLTFGVWFGASLYYAFVYLPQVRHDWRAQ